MLRVKIAGASSGKTGEKSFECPWCYSTEWFYNFVPQSCSICRHRFPNVMNIMNDNNARIKYHLDGNPKM